MQSLTKSLRAQGKILVTALYESRVTFSMNSGQFYREGVGPFKVAEGSV